MRRQRRTRHKRLPFRSDDQQKDRVRSKQKVESLAAHGILFAYTTPNYRKISQDKSSYRGHRINSSDTASPAIDNHKKILENSLERKKGTADHRYHVCYSAERYRARESDLRKYLRMNKRGKSDPSIQIRRRSKFRKARTSGDLFRSPRRGTLAERLPRKIYNKAPTSLLPRYATRRRSRVHRYSFTNSCGGCA